ncbi:hypothetical protein Ccar_16210 [Clostridium carboxidivorans P7]|uniref:Uncharacterized protein n=1 Tax=Clostridium carboxidivorans P7 TaxID=536227 RepID=C6PT26_9CLOT|nr:hypothetical protein [Clostridium carboxidivorans]AKN32322.1 hypothetical protein Ccar_16210 [Clostridium carboxidivorans P7]EET87661.1 hypothetical protein CcarbDRAFT_1943 [Clostridium carboxidivorans P7]
MIVTKKTISRIEDTINFNKALNAIKEFSIRDFSDIDVIFHFKIVGRKELEFYILYTCGGGNEVITDLTNKTVVDKLSEFKFGTAKDFSKTLVKNWDRLCYEDDGNFKI